MSSYPKLDEIQVIAQELNQLSGLSLPNDASVTVFVRNASDFIANLKGRLISKLPNSVIIDVGGVGYEVSIPLSSFYDLGEIGAEVALRIHTHVREDALQLFGFRTSREKELFLKLTSVSGIGPKLALTALSGMPADDLILAIRTNDLARLTAIPGVGKKTAERL